MKNKGCSVKNFDYDKGQLMPEFTDWDAECDLLKEYLAYRIEHYPRRLLNLGNTEKSPSEILRIYKDMGFIFQTSIVTIAKQGPFIPITFEDWKFARHFLN